MAQSDILIGSIREVAEKIRRMEDRLMEDRPIPMTEQQAMHTEIRRLRKLQDDLEKRTR